MRDRRTATEARPGRLPLVAAPLLAVVVICAGWAAGDGLEEDGCRALLATAEAAPQGSADAPFTLQFGDQVSPYSLMTTSLAPGAEIEVEVVLARPFSGEHLACADGGVLIAREPGKWLYRAPAIAGEVATIGVVEPTRREMSRLRVLVLSPYRGEESLEGFHVGAYRQQPLRGLDAYRPPSGLFRVDPDDVGLALSPHFRLGQFLSKQGSGYPKFVLVSTRLLLKLEGLLEAFNEAGIEASTLAIMSGFRTPSYNLEIGNRTVYSRHLFGDAADIFVDEDGDGRMDDLNGDGRIDVEDARLLAKLVESLRQRAWYAPLVGGLGVYGPAPHRGPFIHIDTRGTIARWSSS